MSEILKYQNVFRGIIIASVVTFGAYLLTSAISFGVGFFIFPGVFLFVDLQFLIGTVVGVIYFLKNRRDDQSILLYGIVVGIVGGIIAAFFIAIYQWIILLSFSYFVGYFLNGLISGVFIGFLISVIICVYFMYREIKSESPEKKQDEDFLKDLIED